MAKKTKNSDKSSRRREYSAPALEKGMSIIELLAEAETGLTVSDIANRLNRRMSELFRIIVVMERNGWLRKDPETSRYYVSYHLLLLAHRGTPARSLSAAAAPVMEDLSARVNQSCHLVIKSGNQCLVILRQENQRRQANLSVRLGAVIGLMTSCSGLVLLSSLEQEERDAMIRSLPARRNLPRAKLDATLARIRKQGFQVQRSPVTEGVSDISCPVRGFDGQVVAALTVPYLHVTDNSLSTSVDEARRQLEQAARRISRTLGWAG